MCQIELKNFYSNLGTRKKSPRQLFREQVLKECKITNQTFYRWISGKSKPNEAKRQILSKITGIPSQNLFL